MSRCWALTPAARFAILLAGILILTATPIAAEMPGAPQGGGQAGGDTTRPEPVCQPSLMDSPYIPVDSWIYPAVLRLYSMGFIDTVFLGMRPWTRASVSHMLEHAGARIDDADPGPATDEAQSIYEALNEELTEDTQGPCGAHQGTDPAGVGLHRGARDQRHAFARQLPSWPNHCERLWPPVCEWLQ